MSSSGGTRLGEPRVGGWRREVRAFLELVALTGVAVAQPTLDILSKNASVFVTRRTNGFQVVAFTLIVVVVPAAALWAIEALTGLVVPAARRYVHAALAALLVGVITVEVAKKQTELSPRALLALAAVIGIAAGAAIWRFDVVRLWLRYLSVAPVIFAALFLFFSPVTSVVFREGPTSAAHVTIAKPSRLVMITLDEFPIESLLDGTGHIDATLFPHFAELANTSTWYRNTTTVAPYTQVAVPAILTGDDPTDDYPPPVASVYPHNLFTLLGGAYQMNVHETATRLCPAAICGKTQRAEARGHNGFRGLLEDAYDAWHEFASPERQQTVSLTVRQSPTDADALTKGDDFVTSLGPGDRAQLDFLHVLLPHQPWHYLPTGQDYQQTKGASGLTFYNWANDWTALAGRQRHLLQVQAADRLLGRVIDKLKRVGAWQNSLVVLTADHGVAFTAKNSIRGASATNYPQVMWVPFFVKTPGQTNPIADDRPARTIDVLPTIADLLHTRIPWKTDGHTILTTPRPDGQRILFHWKLNQLQPPPGKNYLTVDGPTGFAAAMRGQASTADGDPKLRLYRIGDYANLVGTPVSALSTGGDAGFSASLDTPANYDRVDPKAKDAPWVYTHGTVHVRASEQPLVIAVNGTIAGLSEIYGIGTDTSEFWAPLVPEMFTRGKNDVRLYVVRGGPDAPKLESVQLTG